MRRRTTISLAIATTAGVATPLAFAATTPDYRTLIVKSGKKSIQATLGTHCVPTPDGTGSCAEATYPLKTAGAVSVSRGGEVTLLFKAPVGDVRWRAARIANGKEIATAYGIAKVVTKTKKRWRVVLPKNLRRSSKLLGFDVQSPNAYASFEVGIRVR